MPMASAGAVAERIRSTDDGRPERATGEHVRDDGAMGLDPPDDHAAPKLPIPSPSLSPHIDRI
jgi:hypothetical protein